MSIEEITKELDELEQLDSLTDYQQAKKHELEQILDNLTEE